MKKILILLLMVVTMAPANAQILVGDMNDDGEIRVGDVAILTNTVLGKTAKRYIDSFSSYNAAIWGLWTAADNEQVNFREDNTCVLPDGTYTYAYQPQLARVVIYDGEAMVKAYNVMEVSADKIILNAFGTAELKPYYFNQVASLTISETSAVMNTGDQLQLTVSTTPDNATNTRMQWTSSDETIATVDDNGLVTALKGGTVTITATTKDGSNLTATCELTITQLATSLTLNASELYMDANDTYQLVTTILPADVSSTSVKWTSSDPDIVYVNKNGKLMAQDNGTVTITCSALDGSGLTATCVVTVTSQAVKSVSLDVTTLTLAPSATYTLTPTLTPTDALNTEVEWSSSDESIATVDEFGEVTGVSPGTATITCTVVGGQDVSANCEVKVAYLVSNITFSTETIVTFVGDSPSLLTATVSPTYATDKSITWSSSDESVATVVDGEITPLAIGTTVITCSANDGSGVKAECVVKVTHEWVDLGLPSGTLWATCNVGASSPEGYGDYFAWGETTGYNSGKTTFCWSTYTLCNGLSSSMTKYCTNISYGTVDKKTELDVTDDAASVNWGSDWRMPSKTQLVELINSSYTTTTWTTQNGVYGRLITSKTNGNSIFLPAAGYCDDSGLDNAGAYGCYWSRTLYSDNSSYAYGFYFHSSDVGTYYYHRFYGRSVRPVRVSE